MTGKFQIKYCLDLMVCNGGEMEQWVEKVVASLDTENMKVLTMMDYVDVLEEEIVEGMEDNEHSHDDHGHAHENEEEDHDHSEMDHSRPDDEIKTHENLSQITFDDHDGHEMGGYLFHRIPLTNSVPLYQI